MLGFLFGQSTVSPCRHDWETLIASTAAEVQHQVACEETGEYVMSVLFPDDGRMLYRRVCIECGKIDDQIAEATEAARIDWRRRAERRAKAQQIYDAAHGTTKGAADHARVT